MDIAWFIFFHSVEMIQKKNKQKILELKMN